MILKPGASLCLAGAVAGAAAWMCYGAAEFALCYDIPLLFGANRVFSPWAWPLAGALFLSYAAIGAVSGILAAAVVRWRMGPTEGAHELRVAVALTLPLAFALNLAAASPLSRAEYVALGVDGAIIAALVACVRSRGWRDRFSGLASPWAVSFLFLAVPWMSRVALHDSSGAVKAAASLAALALTAGVSIGAGRRWPGLRPAASLAAVAGIVLVSWIANRGVETPLRAEASQLTPRDRLNVVLITMDAVRADHLSVYGYERDTTPNLRALAREATVYKRAIASAEMTLPTHASIFTGVYASWHGAHYAPPSQPYGRPLGPKYATLAGVLASRGYATLAVAANYAYIQTDFGLDRGFQVFDSKRPVVFSEAETPFLLREGVRALLGRAFSTAEFDMPNRRADEINGDALRLVDRAGQAGKPFFLFLNYMDAHAPYLPPAPFDTRFPGKDPRFTFPEYLALQREVLEGKRTVSGPLRRHLISQYDGGIAYIDTAIGGLISELKRRGVFANTLFIVMGDHGEAFGERGLLEHAVASVDQNQVHVPLMIRYPGASAPAVCDDLVSQVDIMPTVLEELGYPLPAGIQGRSLLSPLPAERFVVTEAFPQPLAPRLERAIYRGAGKLVISSSGERKYFDLSQDPQEESNRYRPGGLESTPLEAQLDGWIKKIPKRTAAPSQLGDGSLQRLKSLGYVQ
jgi:arylsulfatase A-like enzyme